MQVLHEELEIGPDPAEVGRARRWARARLARAGVAADEPLAETLVLLVSELVTNAVVHTGRDAVLSLMSGARGRSVRLEVADASRLPPRTRRAAGDETSGRGLELVSGLADRWGWEQEEGGKRVWCEVEPGSCDAGGRGRLQGSGRATYLGFERLLVR